MKGGGTRLRCQSALGYLVLIVPDMTQPPGGPRRWFLLTFKPSGRWAGGHTAPMTWPEATRERAKMIRHHRTLAAERAARAAKRKPVGR